MPLNIVEVGKQFRPKTSHVYPPFKHGRYMEEYVYDYFMEHCNRIETACVYIPIFWTNLQNHPGFSTRKESYQLLLDTVLKPYPRDTLFFTVVQHDDGPQLYYLWSVHRDNSLTLNLRGCYLSITEGSVFFFGTKGSSGLLYWNK